jgi:hypothetical protein
MKNKFFFILQAVFIAATAVSAQWSIDTKLPSTNNGSGLNENMGTCLVTSGDTIHVVWCDTATGDRAIYYKRSIDAGVTWNTEIRLTSPSGQAAFPAIACAGTSLHVVYRDTHGPKNVSYYKHSLDGGNTWGPDVVLDSAYWWPSVTAKGALVYVVLNDTFYTNGVSNSEVYLRRSLDNGTTWGAIQRISNAAGRSEDPAIGTDGVHVYLAWNDNRTGIMQTWFRRSLDSGATWEAERQLTNSTVMAYSPMIHVYGPDIYVPWEDRRNSDANYDIYLIHSSDFGATWGMEQRMATDVDASGYPDIVRDGQNIHLVWQNMPGSLYYMHSGNAGTTWDAPVKLADSTVQPMQPFVGLTGQVVNVIWSDIRNGHRTVYYKRNPTGNMAVNTGALAGNGTDPSNSKFSASFDRGCLSVNLSGHDYTSFTVYDIFGRKLHTLTANQSAARFSPGTYIVKPEGINAGAIRVFNVK